MTGALAAVSLFEGIGATELAILFAALAYVTHLVLDALGISRTSRNLRVENEDLVRRNKELEDSVGRCGDDIDRLKGELGVLVPRVEELSARDQAAVLAAIAEHVRQATIRHEAALAVLTDIRDAVRAGNGNSTERRT